MSASCDVTTNTIVSVLILNTKCLQVENTAVNWTIQHMIASMNETLYLTKITFIVEQK